MTASPKKSVVRLALEGGEVDVQYRRVGEGPPLLMLHPSPLSSAFLEPQMLRLAHRVTAIAPDTPGYGKSTAIAGPVRDLTPYVEAMRAFCDALGLTAYALYGSATGAQIAIELAKVDAARVTGVILDNAADFSDEERERIMDGYFPDLTPSEDGHHLARAWQVAHDSTLFFPWHCKDEGSRIAATPAPAEAMNLTALGYLRAGPEYEKAYRAAFHNERAERIQAISVPVSIIRWKSGILKRFTDRFDACDWGENVRMAHCDAGMEQRLACVEAELAHCVGVHTGMSASVKAADSLSSTRYLDTSYGQVRFRIAEGAVTAARRMALHAPGASIDSMGVPVGRHEVALDLPGHGESGCPCGAGMTYLDACVEAVRGVAAACGMRDFSLRGEGGSSLLAKRLAESCGAGYIATESQPVVLRPPPDLVSSAAGEHLWRGWYWLRTEYLASGLCLPDAACLTERLLDLVTSATAHIQLHRLLETLR